jgi:signal transduction histidine kinase
VAIPQTRARAPRAAHPTVAHAVEERLLEERTSWAMHIHDGLTQAVTSAVLEIQSLRHRIETDPAEAIEALSQVEGAIRQDLQEIRQVLFELHEGRKNAAAGREPTLAALVHELVERWKLPARISIQGDVDHVPHEVAEAAHAIIAEALANAAKHSGSADVAVRVRANAHELQIEVEDRGRGMSPVDDEMHFGLHLMRTRAEKLGGSIEIGSNPGPGTRVVAVLPVGGRGDTR